MTPLPVKRSKRRIEVAIPLEAIHAAARAPRGAALPRGISVDSSAGVASSRTPLATITIRNFDEHTKAQLRIQAARHGRSMEGEQASQPVYVSRVDWGVPGFAETQKTYNLAKLLAAGKKPH